MEKGAPGLNSNKKPRSCVIRSSTGEQMNACGAVVRGSLHTYTIDGSITPVANQAIHPSGVAKLVPEESEKMKD
ncbi:hypothetical protein Y032_0038g3575 [Ancylostoma ceylanicum]|uniref:Uncharacterized protein n=1 Tax=Ancylostoma ceylanicum TaxID=53326 RepID=A0A016UKJ4_9BILA|nr:hypothetical protein Y032_0038g3575 [Ancylostoma ceylanicum]